jgi:hypothetical protein
MCAGRLNEVVEQLVSAGSQAGRDARGRGNTFDVSGGRRPLLDGADEFRERRFSDASRVA